MKKFEEASLEVVEFDAQDVIATSGGCPPDVSPWQPGSDSGCGSGGIDMCD